MKLSDYVVQFVADQGVRHVFMVPGGGAMHLNDSLGRCRGLTFVSHSPRTGRGIAAEAYAKVTNSLGVASSHRSGRHECHHRRGRRLAGVDPVPDPFRAGQAGRSQRRFGVRQLGAAGSRHRLHRHADHQVRGHGDGSTVDRLEMDKATSPGADGQAGPGLARHPARRPGRADRPGRAGALVAPRVREKPHRPTPEVRSSRRSSCSMMLNGPSCWWATASDCRRRG